MTRIFCALDVAAAGTPLNVTPRVYSVHQPLDVFDKTTSQWKKKGGGGNKQKREKKKRPLLLAHTRGKQIPMK